MKELGAQSLSAQSKLDMAHMRSLGGQSSGTAFTKLSFWYANWRGGITPFAFPVTPIFPVPFPLLVHSSHASTKCDPQSTVFAIEESSLVLMWWWLDHLPCWELHWHRGPKICIFTSSDIRTRIPGTDGAWRALYQLCKRTTQLSNLRWMPNTVSKGFDNAMKTGSSRRFKQYPTTYRGVSSWLPFSVD